MLFILRLPTGSQVLSWRKASSLGTILILPQTVRLKYRLLFQFSSSYLLSSCWFKVPWTFSLLFKFGFYCCDKNHDQKQFGKSPLKKANVEIQGRTLEAGTEAEVIKECCLLTYLVWLAQFSFSYPRTICPGVAPLTVGCALRLTSIINQAP